MGRLKEKYLNNIDASIPLEPIVYDDLYVDGSLDYLYSTPKKKKVKKVKKKIATTIKVDTIVSKKSGPKTKTGGF